LSDQDAKATEHRLFQQAVEAFMRRQYPQALPLLERAAVGGDAEAQNLLGVMQLNGMGTAPDARRAAACFADAAAQGLKEAQYNLSNLLFNGLGVAADEARAIENLLAAARAGHRPALRSLGFLYHDAGADDAHWATLATYCFRQAAEAGDPQAQYFFALRLVHGHGVPVDPAAAAQWFAAAAQSGVYLAAARLAALQQPAEDRTRLPAAKTVLELMNCPLAELPEPQPSRAKDFMSEHSRALDGYLCDHLINLAAPMLTPSNVVDPQTGAAMQSEFRTSHSMHYQPSMYDAATHLALRRIARIAGSPVSHAEPLGVLRYGLGQEYRPHYDFYSDDQHEAQRVATVFVYLNAVEEGGGTAFPRIGMTVEPELGKAVKFLNCDAAGQPNPETLHAGLPVVRGEKWLATLWFWDRPFDWFR
jgi:TPR repeat protein